jgi:cell division transport system ATP-binding protein
MLEFKKVSKIFGSIKALSDISFKVNEGDFVFLIGPSGSGKTTLLNLIIHKFPPSQGEIIFDKQPIHNLKKSKIPTHRRKIGAVFQDYKLLPERTIRENIELPLAIIKVPNKEWTKRVDDTLSLVGLSDRSDLFPSQLSGGELQRAALARALVIDPKLIFAD